MSFLGSWLMLMLAATLVVHAVQTRGLFVPASVSPKAVRLSPSRIATGFRVACIKVLTAPLKLTFLSSLFSWKLGGALVAFPALLWREPWNVTSSLLTALNGFAVFSALLIFAWGLVDLGLKARERVRGLAMSDDELRKEQAESEGSPFVRSARRQMHELLATQDLVARVRRARVIVVEKA